MLLTENLLAERSTGINSLLDEDGSEIISYIKLEIETLGISPRVTKQV